MKLDGERYTCKNGNMPLSDRLTIFLYKDILRVVIPVTMMVRFKKAVHGTA